MDRDNKQIDRIRDMEARFDDCLRAVSDIDAAMARFRDSLSDLRQLIAYYASPLWRQDFDDDRAGKLPRDLKRGILSEDGIYDLLSDAVRLSNEMDELKIDTQSVIDPGTEAP